MKKNWFLESWNYIKESKRYIFLILAFFVLFIFIGGFFKAPEEIGIQIMNFIKELQTKTEGLNTFQLIIFIFKNNLFASFFGMLFGLFFGIYPILVSILNAYVLGFVSRQVVFGSSIFELWRLFPHGIFELPAVIISLGLGLKLGFAIFSKKKLKEFKRRFFLGLKTILCIILPLLVIAAIIEGILIKVLS